MALTQRIAFLGAGNMAEALVKGLLKSKACAADQIYATDIRENRLAELREAHGIQTGPHNAEAVQWADVVVLATKPQVLDRVMQEIAPNIGKQHLVVSIAAGVPLSVIEHRLGKDRRLVRVMPNTPALVQCGATAIARGAAASEADLDVARTLFNSVGTTVALDESLLDAVTGLSGSGPAYIFMIIEALADAGVKVGLGRDTAQRLAAQTVLGSAKLLIETGEHPGRLKDMVTSPGGTAIAGLHTLESGGLRTTLMNAVEAASRRAADLGEQARKKSSE